MLIHTSRCGKPGFIAPECFRKEPGLLQKPSGATVIRVFSAERVDDQFLEPLDHLRLTPKLVIEAKDLGDEPRPDAERQIAAICGRIMGGGLRDRVTFKGCELAGWICASRVQRLVQLIAGDHCGHDIAAEPSTRERVLERRGGRPCRHDHHAIARVSLSAAEPSDHLTKLVEVGDPDEPCLTRGYHRGS
jgi:hypothetical protein